MVFSTPGVVKTTNKQIGQIGEQLAAEYLEKKGYQILERNWGNKFGEIDIICSYYSRGGRYYTPGVKGNLLPHQVCIDRGASGVLVFVEVKTKIGEAYGTPEEMVNRRKLAKIQRMASQYFLASNKAKRIDVVAIVLNHQHQLVRLNHYEAVYYG